MLHEERKAFFKKKPLASLVYDKGAFFMFTYDASIFLTSTAFVDTKAKYGISLSRYTVFYKTVL